MTSAGSSEGRVRQTQAAAAPGRRGGGRGAAVPLLALLALAASLAAVAAACGGGGGEAGPGAPAPPASPAPAPPAATPHPPGDDWGHVLQVVANLRAAPPQRPLVVLLGGSAARECTESDEAWAAEIGRQGGPAVVAHNLASRNRTLAQNLALVKALPPAPAVVFVGVNVGAFTSTQTRVRLALPPPLTPLPPYRQHRYTAVRTLPPAHKRLLLRIWLEDRAPAFERAFPTAARTLTRLVAACRRRGYTTVLLELPRDTAVTDPRLDPYVDRYRALCRRLARQDGVHWVTYVDRLPLGDRDFYDLWHLVGDGRRLWQRELARTAARLLSP